MTELLVALLVIVLCALCGVTGFIAGRGQINIVAPLTKEQRERNEKMLREAEEQMEEYNIYVRNITGFGGEIDGL